VIGPPERLISALRAVCRQLLPLYTIEELRVHEQKMLPPDLLPTTSTCLLRVVR
jgi:hypothetical protein